MGKKYLLTFSLAAISCLATKSLQSVIINEKEEETVNHNTPSPNTQAQLVLETES